MHTIAQSIYGSAIMGASTSLPKAGTRLENRYVYDASAHEIKAMAEQGRVKIVRELRDSEHEDALITDIAFVKIG